MVRSVSITYMVDQSTGIYAPDQVAVSFSTNGTGGQFGSAVMQPWETLGDQKVADVLTYERSEWGNSATPVTKEQIAALRKELASHPGSYTEPEILAAPEQDLPGGEGGAPPAGGQPPKQ